MRMLLSELKDKPEEDIRRGLEMLVRAYDPCISCLAHARLHGAPAPSGSSYSKVMEEKDV